MPSAYKKHDERPTLPRDFGKKDKKARLMFLQKYYRIKGDGVAELRLDEAQDSNEFKDSLARLKESRDRLLGRPQKA